MRDRIKAAEFVTAAIARKNMSYVRERLSVMHCRAATGPRIDFGKSVDR